MEQANERQVKAEAGSLSRMLVKGVVVGALAAVVALGINGPLLAAGALAGGLAAGLYASGYLKTHISRAGARERMYDPAIARAAILRLVAVAAVGAGAFALGRPVLKAYLASFAVCFAVLVISEIPRAKQTLRARGVIG